MMANNRLGDLRRSAAIMTFGPGSVVDFRSGEAAISAVVGGLEEWDRSFPPAGLANPQRIMEPRLQKKLFVKGFRLPPVAYKDWPKNIGNSSGPALVAVRFPKWLQCPQCNLLAMERHWKSDPGQPYRYCGPCTKNAPGQRKVFAVPVRFIMACAKGHLDDFPWHFWVKHKDSCEKKEHARLYLKSESPGLGGLILSCRGCKAKRSMDGVFSAQTWRRFKCQGQRPWLATMNETCDCQPRVLQRGASNLYFPILKSALSIPPWSDELQDALGVYWSSIVNVVDTNPEKLPAFIEVLAHGELASILGKLGLSPEELARQVENRISRYKDDSIDNIHQEEFQQFLLGSDTAEKDKREFEMRSVSVPERLRPFFSHIVRIVRLREVRALKGFTRINPPGDEDSPDIAKISAGKLDWLPAIEVRGEGIFLAFDQEKLHPWETRNLVIERAQSIHEKWRIEWKERYGGGAPVRQITPRYLLVHTFAHALMRQLSLECGYSTASLRERLYVDNENEEMAGLLIYTATSDSDGTLGGLQRQGQAHRIKRSAIGAIQAMEWCSSDPLCVSRNIVSDGLSLAACHACVLAPETACEEYNRFLDRALLVGLPDKSEVGFFSSILQGG